MGIATLSAAAVVYSFSATVASRTRPLGHDEDGVSR
jgi:hypothetical protein